MLPAQPRELEPQKHVRQPGHPARRFEPWLPREGGVHVWFEAEKSAPRVDRQRAHQESSLCCQTRRDLPLLRLLDSLGESRPTRQSRRCSPVTSRHVVHRFRLSWRRDCRRWTLGGRRSVFRAVRLGNQASNSGVHRRNGRRHRPPLLLNKQSPARERPGIGGG